MINNKTLKLLNNELFGICIGSMLGDGYVEKRGKNSRITWHHGFKQKDYLEYKCSKFFKSGLSSGKRTQTSTGFIGRTYTKEGLTWFREKFYVDRKKVVPKDISLFLSPIALAIWIMDDGSNDRGGLRLHTESFKENERQLLLEALESKYSIKGSIISQNPYRVIRIDKDSVGIIREITKPYIIESLKYKLI